MTTRRIHEQSKLILSSLDIKPTDSVIGTEIWEYDSNLTWVCYDKVAGVAQWTLKG